MPEFRISQDTDSDLLDTALYTVSEFGEKQAIKYKTEIYQVFRDLANNPDLGRDASFLMPYSKRYNPKAHSIFYGSTTNVMDPGRYMGRAYGSLIRGAFCNNGLKSVVTKKLAKPTAFSLGRQRGTASTYFVATAFQSVEFEKRAV